MTRQLDHFLQEVVDFVLSATEVSTLDKVVGLLSPSPSWVVQLEGPQEVGSVLEVWSNSENLVDQILNTDNSHLAHRKLEAYLKFGPTVKISWIKSSTQIIPILPNLSSMISLEVIGVLFPSTLTNPRL